MGGSGVTDQYQNVFTTYIDSGFGLLGGDMRFLSQTLIALDITPAGLFWALAGAEDVIARLIKKTLTRLRSGQLPNPTARQLRDLSTTIWIEPSSAGDTRHRGALSGESYRLATAKKDTAAIRSRAKRKPKSTERRRPHHRNLNRHGSTTVNRGFAALIS